MAKGEVLAPAAGLRNGPMCIRELLQAIIKSLGTNARQPADNPRWSREAIRLFPRNGAMVNITLSAEEELVAKARAYAQSRQTTVNQLIRDYLRRLTGQIDPHQAAAEFAELARTRGGCSDEGFVFDRGDLHARGTGASR